MQFLTNYVFIYDVMKLSAAWAIWSQMVQLLNNDLERMWMEAAMA